MTDINPLVNQVSAKPSGFEVQQWLRDQKLRELVLINRWRWGQWSVINQWRKEQGPPLSPLLTSVWGSHFTEKSWSWLVTCYQQWNQITELKSIQNYHKICFFLRASPIITRAHCTWLCSCFVLCAWFSKWGTVLFSALTIVIAIGKQSYDQCIKLSCIRTTTGTRRHF